MKHFWTTVVFLGVASRGCMAAQILAILPLAAVSHQVMFKPILRELARRGHEVTVITASPDHGANYTQVVIDNSYEKHKETINYFELHKNHRFKNFFSIARIGERAEHATLGNAEVQRIIHSTALSFDLVMVEATFAQEALVVFGHKFRAPVVELGSMSASVWLNWLIGNPNPFSYVVDFRSRSSDRMDFAERLSNTIGGIVTVVLHSWWLLPEQEAIARKYFNYTGWESRPPLRQLLSDISLVVLNTHVALHYPHPTNPNVVQVAGVHLQPPGELPEELQEFLDDSTEGVVYFSLGSNVKGSMMPEEVRNAFVQAFRKLSCRVLWKWETDSLPGRPHNVRISKWLPQTDILAHPNVKVFISHGGFLSVTESVHNGVPMIIIPLFSDQWKNGKQAETAGFGVTLDINNITEAAVTWAVKEMLTQPKYQKAARKQSTILHDNPMKPLDTVIFWIEYVIRHQGAAHLQTAATRLSWYQYWLIDVAVVLVFSTLTIMVIVYKVLKACFYVNKRLYCVVRNSFFLFSLCDKNTKSTDIKARSTRVLKSKNSSIEKKFLKKD